jgi:hypothetical protein
MRHFIRGVLALALAGCVSLVGCANLGKTQNSPNYGSSDSTASQSPQASSARAAAPLSNRLETPVFAKLPPDARLYLEALSLAFRTQDIPFLMSQGELQYEAQLRPRYDEGSYLAMLYRAGPWAQEYNGKAEDVPDLKPQEILGIEYISWEVEGPMLEIRGELFTTQGKTIPCVIVFNPRLREPKILGVYP